LAHASGVLSLWKAKIIKLGLKLGLLYANQRPSNTEKR